MKHLIGAPILLFFIFSFHTSSAQLPTYVPASGLLAYWGFNGNGNDQSGNGVTGTVSGPSYITDRYGHANAALGYSGSGEKVTTKKIDRTATNSISYSVWVNPSSSFTIPLEGSGGAFSSTSPYTCVISPVDGWAWSSLSTDVGAGLNVATNGVYVSEHGPGITKVSLAWSGTLTGWHHIAVVYDAKTPILYVDGSKVRTGVPSTYTVHPSMGCDSFALGLGSYPYLAAGFGHGLYPITVPSYNFMGGIDDIAIYGRALTPCEVTQLYDTIVFPLAITGTMVVCQASTTKLLANFPGGRWTSGNSATATVDSTSGIVSGISGGTSAITYTMGTGCRTSAVVTVTPFPPIAGVPAVCPGTTTTLSNAITPGTWTSSDPSIATINPSSGVALGLIAGTTVISYTISSGCSRTQALTVNPLPGPIAGLTTVCPGSTTLLTCPGGGTWISGNTSAATIALTGGILSGVSTGTSVITYTLPTGCINTITVNIMPMTSPITGAGNICSGQFAALSDTWIGGSWTSSNTNVVTIGHLTGVMLGNNTGTATITYAAGAGCYVTKNIVVDSVPALSGPNVVCTGQTIALNASLPGGAWGSAANTIATVGSTGVVTGVTAGSTAITYTVPGGCTGFYTILVNPMTSTSISGTAAICVSASSTLSGGTGGGTWISGNTSVAVVGIVSGIVFAVSPGTSTITYTNTYGCILNMTTTVNANPAPLSPAMRTCVGSSVLLTDATPGGVWVLSNTAVGTVDSVSGMLSGIASGTSSVAYTLSTGCKANGTVTVNALPKPITGMPLICLGASSALSTVTGGGLWTSSNTPVATVSSSGVVNSVSNGVSIIEYKVLSTGCATSVAVTVTPAPGSIGGTTKICAGNTSLLTNVVPGGTWTSSNIPVATIDPVGLVSGIASGTSSITYSLGGGCIATTVVTVYPTAPVTGPSGVCAGQKLSLSDALAGGTWSSGTPAVATVNTLTGQVTGVSAGSVLIYYNLPSGCYVTKSIAVSSAMVPIAGPSGVCNGSTALFNDLSTGGSWNSSNSLILPINAVTGVANALAVGMCTISYSLGTGCETTMNVTVNALPAAVSGGTHVCVAGTLQLSDATGGGAWSAATTAISITPATGIVKGFYNGTAAVSYTLGTGCSAAYVVTVDSLPAPIAGTNNACIGGTAILTDATPGGLWNTGSSLITITSGTGVVTALYAGTATITYTDGNGCRNNAVFSVNAAPAAITGSVGVCLGATLFLSDATPGGIWSSSDTTVIKADTAIGRMGGRTVGTATIDYTLPTGCTISSLLQVYNVLPVTGPGVVCTGKTIALSNGISGGVWNSSSITIASVGSSTGTVGGVAVGTATITYTNPNGCASSSSMIVNPTLFPGIITGTSIVCPGYIVALSDTVLGGVWSSASANVYVPPTGGTVRGVLAGTATITYGVTNSCGTSMALHTMTILPLPPTTVISAPDSMCEGTSTVFAAGIPGGEWSTMSTSIIVGSSSGKVTGISAGTATVTYVYVNVCGAAVDKHTIKVNPLPAAGVISGAPRICAGTTTYFIASQPGGVWTTTNTHALVVAGLVTGVSQGNDTVVYTVTNSCGIADTFRPIAVDPLPDAGSVAGIDSICPGLTTAMTSTVTGGNWVSSNTMVATIGSSSGTVTGISPGTVTLTYSVTAICGTDYKVKRFKVNQLPDAGMITCADTICNGRYTVLSDVVAGGVWNNANGLLSVITNDTLTAISAGKDTVLYTVSNICGSATTTHAIVIAPQPQAGSIAGIGQLCIGNTLQLSDANEGGTWSIATTTVGAIDNGLLTCMSAGIDTVFYTVINRCGIAITSAPIEVMSLPVVATLTGVANVCTGASIILSEASAGGVWESINGNATVVNGVVTGDTVGSATIRYSITNSCGTSYTYKQLSVDGPPSPGVISVADSVCLGDSISVYATVKNGTWSVSNAQLLNIKPSGNIVTLTAGMDTVIYTVTNTCGASSVQHQVKVRSAKECAGPDTVKHAFDCSGNGEVFIYPNPNPGLFTVKVVSDLTEDVIVEIFDLWGQRVMQFTQQTNVAREIHLLQPQGVYIVSIIGEHGHCSKHLVIDR